MAARRPRDIGTDAERELVRWLACNGWPYAERRALHGNQDAGDVTGTPGIAWSVKAGEYAREPSDRQIGDWLDELHDQRERAGAGWCVLVTRRWRTGTPGLWWAWMPLTAVILLGGGPATSPWPGLRALDGDPVRMHVVSAVELLQEAGYGGEG